VSVSTGVYVAIACLSIRRLTLFDNSPTYAFCLSRAPAVAIFLSTSSRSSLFNLKIHFFLIEWMWALGRAAERLDPTRNSGERRKLLREVWGEAPTAICFFMNFTLNPAISDDVLE